YQSSHLLQSVAEAIQIGEESGTAVQISHLKATGRANWGKVAAVLEIVDRARERGVDVTCDRYPYVASSTGLSAMVPPWVHEGGPTKLVERLKDSRTRRRVAEEMVLPEPLWENFGMSVGWDKILIADCASNRGYEGRNIAEIAAERGQDARDCVFDLLIENDAHVACVLFSMGEEDVVDALRHPSVTIGSDSRAAAPYGPLGKGKPHPRAYGTFPRVLAEYVRNRRSLTWEDAVAKMTSRPADRLGLRGRGRVAAGCFADIVVLDPETVADQATFMEPHQYPIGIEYVIVNGTVVVDGGEHTGMLPGKSLSRGR
ncbi:MAG: amidohydrolase family protein, partial [Actinobacteria bacterium]|nr:amidohydrolase family protein [Actinomycetota bacterium]